MRRSVSVSVSEVVNTALAGETERHGGRLGAVAMPSGPVVQCAHRLKTLPSGSNISSIWWADAMGQLNAVQRLRPRGVVRGGRRHHAHLRYPGVPRDDLLRGAGPFGPQQGTC